MIDYDWQDRNSSTDKHVNYYKEQISKLPNRELLDDFVDMAAGDVYDGCYTKQGQVVYNLLQAEVEERLKDWLAKE